MKYLRVEEEFYEFITLENGFSSGVLTGIIDDVHFFFTDDGF